MSIVDDYARNMIDMFSDGRKKKCKDAARRYNELVSGATDQELQEIADKTGENFEELKDRRERFRETLGESKKSEGR